MTVSQPITRNSSSNHSNTLFQQGGGQWYPCVPIIDEYLEPIGAAEYAEATALQYSQRPEDPVQISVVPVSTSKLKTRPSGLLKTYNL